MKAPVAVRARGAGSAGDVGPGGDIEGDGDVGLSAPPPQLTEKHTNAIKVSEIPRVLIGMALEATGVDNCAAMGDHRQRGR